MCVVTLTWKPRVVSNGFNFLMSFFSKSAQSAQLSRTLWLIVNQIPIVTACFVLRGHQSAVLVR